MYDVYVDIDLHTNGPSSTVNKKRLGRSKDLYNVAYYRIKDEEPIIAVPDVLARSVEESLGITNYLCQDYTLVTFHKLAEDYFNLNSVISIECKLLLSSLDYI